MAYLLWIGRERLSTGRLRSRGLKNSSRRHLDGESSANRQVPSSLVCFREPNARPDGCWRKRRALSAPTVSSRFRDGHPGRSMSFAAWSDAMISIRLAMWTGCWWWMELAVLKKGTGSAGVARQYSGTVGRIENCQIGVFAAHASRFCHTLVDRHLYLPKARAEDATCRARAHVPEELETPTILQCCAAFPHHAAST